MRCAFPPAFEIRASPRVPAAPPLPAKAIPPHHDGVPGIRCNVARDPGKTALICGARTLTYGQLIDRIDLVCAMAVGLGLKPGDRAAIIAGNCMEYIEIVDGLAEAGIAVATLNPCHTAAELGYILQDCGARIAFVSAEAKSSVQAADAPALERIIVIGGDYDALLQKARPATPPDIAEWSAFLNSLHVRHHRQAARRGAAASVAGADRLLHGVGIWLFTARRQLPRGHTDVPRRRLSFAHGSVFFGGTCEICAAFDPE